MMSSGMGATACALMALLRPGDHLLACRWLYGGTQRLFMEEFTALGINVTLVDPIEARGWRKRMRKETRAVFLESPVNPTCRVIDLRPVSYLAHGERAGPGRRLDVREPDQFRPAGARRRRRDPLGDQVPERPSRCVRRRGARHRLVHGGSAAEDDRVGPGPGSVRLLAAGAGAEDAGRSRPPTERERGLRSRSGATSGARSERVHYPGLQDHPDHESATRADRRLRWDARTGAGGGREGRGQIRAKAAADPARAEPGGRGFARERAALLVARAYDAGGAREGRACRTASFD